MYTLPFIHVLMALYNILYKYCGTITLPPEPVTTKCESRND